MLAERIPRRSGKSALLALQAMECHSGPVGEGDLPIQGRLHPSHDYVRHGPWIECTRCHKTTKWADKQRLMWTSLQCQKLRGQQPLLFGPSSES